MQTLSSSQVSAEVPINENFANVLQAEIFAKNPLTTTGLTWGYVGGQFVVNGVPTTIANGTVALTASVTNYVGLTQAGAVANAATTPNPLHIPLFTVVTTSSGISTVTPPVDTRNPKLFDRMSYGSMSQALTTANVTLTQAQALCDVLIATGALTGIRDFVVPLLRRRWTVIHNGTAFAMRVIGASGTGITIAIGKTADVMCDGTNVVRLTADV